ncbi:DUF4396 domain-containing protein [Methylocystis sp.]|uniref:DUF4396 domain-containing protein n=1 Tax=Methylocystis sp. TaxID=1911079 RepID=UPI003D11BFB2
MLDGVILLWFLLTALSIAFVAIDIRSTPESTVMKWGFVLVTLFTGPFGAFLYVLGCREPLPGLHEAYVATPWRQALGSAMHCVAGDGVGILVGAVIAALLSLPPLADFLLEYALGFMFGWSIFQALFMRDMAGGSYGKALKTTFIPELTSMNCLMAGMAIVSMIGKAYVAGSDHPSSPAFWFIMSMALLIGLCAAYPMNYWLVANKLKHGMTTVRPKGATPPISAMPSMAGKPHMASDGEMAKPDGEHMDEHLDAHLDAHMDGRMDMRPNVSTQMIAFVVGLSFMILMIGLAVGVGFSQKS